MNVSGVVSYVALWLNPLMTFNFAAVDSEAKTQTLHRISTKQPKVHFKRINVYHRLLNMFLQLHHNKSRFMTRFIKSRFRASERLATANSVNERVVLF